MLNIVFTTYIKLLQKIKMIYFLRSSVVRTKYGYDVDENGYLVPCEKEQSVIRLMKILRKKGNSYKSISEKVTKAIQTPISIINK
jgi:hypothetical protein